MVQWSENQLDRIEQKLDSLLKRFEDATKIAPPLTFVREGHHELTPNDEELRRRIAVNERR